MNPGNGIETIVDCALSTICVNFQINESRQRDWNHDVYQAIVDYQETFKLMNPGNGIETYQDCLLNKAGLLSN